MQQEIKLTDAIEAAVALHQRNRLDEAEALYRKILEVAPDNASVLHFHGILLHQRGRSAEAIDSIRRAIALDPGYVDAHNNLGNVLKELERLSEAEAAYRKVLALDECHAGAHNNLGTTLRRLDRFEEAIAEYQRALELDSGNADIRINLGNTLETADRAEDALTAFREAIEMKPLHGSAHSNLGRALQFLGRTDEAAIVYSKWLERDPGNPVAQHMLAAISGHKAPARASNEYVTATFDAFADHFDEKLARLDYRAPRLIAEALERALSSGTTVAGTTVADLLDAGCGTGLCGPLVRDRALRLVGIDLSPRMLDKAKNRGTYDELVRAELTAFMAGRAEAFDAVISADTLIYFGKLEQVLDAAAATLRPSGLLIFSVEEAQGTIGYRLEPHGRYSHSRDYLENSLADAGFNVEKMSHEVLRREGRSDVGGLIVTARRALRRG